MCLSLFGLDPPKQDSRVPVPLSEDCKEGGTMSQVLALASLSFLAVAALDSITLVFLVGG